VTAISIFNDVLGPVMRGPSSSHTAAPYHIGRLARAFFGEVPHTVTFTFDPGGSIAEVYHEQGSDLGFAAGVLGWSLADERFSQALDLAAAEGMRILFQIAPIAEADHPNAIGIHLRSDGGRELNLLAKSTGGGAFVFSQVAGWPVHITGNAHEILLEGNPPAEAELRARLEADGQAALVQRQERDGRLLLHARRYAPLPEEVRSWLEASPDVAGLWTAPPSFFIQRGKPLFASGAEMLALAERRGWSLARTGLAYEAALLGLSEAEVRDEILRRFDVMDRAVQRGLSEDPGRMQLLRPTARAIYQAEAQGRLAVGGLHTRAAARAMAVMHVNGGMGLVCAAPTAGSAGTLPGVVVTLVEDMGLDRDDATRALLAASAVGLIVGMRATFAAEVAGCQVEIGAAGAMAAAAVVEVAGGTARQCADAAAIAFQNTMGSVCDLVQGIVEIPCHTRNAVAASSAFVCADLILGGYDNPVPLDETVDAVFAVGKMLPRELKVTALGGLAMAPSARALPRLR
jgi:L-serine dehydratase